VSTPLLSVTFVKVKEHNCFGFGFGLDWIGNVANDGTQDGKH
jgi:hypothetical protein